MQTVFYSQCHLLFGDRYGGFSPLCVCAQTIINNTSTLHTSPHCFVKPEWPLEAQLSTRLTQSLPAWHVLRPVKSVLYTLLAFFGYLSLTVLKGLPTAFPLIPPSFFPLKARCSAACSSVGGNLHKQNSGNLVPLLVNSRVSLMRGADTQSSYPSWSCSLIRNICFLGVTEVFPLWSCFVRGSDPSCYLSDSISQPSNVWKIRRYQNNAPFCYFFPPKSRGKLWFFFKF